MVEPLDDRYLTWLYARIGSLEETRRTKTYWSLMRYLFTREFVGWCPHDENRVEDGRYLRYEFLDDAGLSGDIDPSWMGMECSVLEMLLALAKRLAFEADRIPVIWFWEMLNNLGLSGYTDREFDERHVAQIVDRLIDRTYEPNGFGGLFPLRHAREDQRRVEILYQMSAYLLEDD